MDYHAHYDKLIERGRNRLLEGYGEWHHIIPRCMGGGDEKENLVHLTAEEHYVAHQLLVKMHPKNHKLVYAATAMANMGHRDSETPNKKYGWLKRKQAIAMSKEMMGNTYGSNNKGQIPWSKGLTKADRPSLAHTEATKKKLSEGRMGRPLSKQNREAIKKAMQGWKPPPRTAEHERKLAAANKARGKIKIKCPHCDVIGSDAPMKLWHFDNCITLKPEGYKRPTYTQIKRATVTCPHCDTTGDVSPMSRWHFDNCKTIKPGYKPRVPIQEVVTCPHCDKSGGISCMKRHHFDNCKTLETAK